MLLIYNYVNHILRFFNYKFSYYIYIISNEECRKQLYIENFENFSKDKKKFYRQKINQDFDTLEKITKNPEKNKKNKI